MPLYLQDLVRDPGRLLLGLQLRLDHLQPDLVSVPTKFFVLLDSAPQVPPRLRSDMLSPDSDPGSSGGPSALHSATTKKRTQNSRVIRLEV